MLKLKNIKKTYVVASDMKVEALKGVSLNFRKNEFVSILGPSGCGKTTLLNIIGGLDKYTDGDLVISGISTKDYSDRDWDIYRNHRIGFIFQSYNLIPHQTILGNVELALTISGIGKEERQKRAKEALDKVGLSGQYYKKPNQLSGGQCQRVAIARALVNEPEILLADEPTGALDTQTSIQIMDLIKEISNEKLVIMVTHNPELALKYSSRIVRLLDGEIIEDTNPFSEEDEKQEIDSAKKYEEEQYSLLTEDEKKKYIKQKSRSKMSFFTAFKLSARNLYSKFKRTIMVVIAGSIGIIGVSAVLAVSQGVRDYIVGLQDDLLSGYPIEITQSSIDYNSLLDSSSLQLQKQALDQGDWVNVNSIIEYLVSNEDVLKELVYNNEINKAYADYILNMPKEYYSAINFDYGIEISPAIYTDFTSPDGEGGSITKNYSLSAITEIYTSCLEQTPYGEYSSYITSLEKVMTQSIDNNDYISNQYDLVYGNMPQNKNDILVVLSRDSTIADLLLAQLGYYSEEEFYNLIFKASPKDFDGQFQEDIYKEHFAYEEIANKKFYWYPNDAIYNYQTTYSMSGYNVQSYTYNYETSLIDNSYQPLELNVCGIVRPKENISYGALHSGFLYTEQLSKYIISLNKDSEIANRIQVSGSVIPGSYGSIKYGIHYDLPYVHYNLAYTEDKSLPEYIKASKPKEAFICKKSTGIMNTFMSYLASSSNSSMVSALQAMDLHSVGGTYVPSAIEIYPLNFDEKFLVTKYLDEWNSENEITYQSLSEDFSEKLGQITLAQGDTSRPKIKYTDSVEIIITMINTMIDIVTYALVAFTALSLIVSTVMVAIITYVSVVERIKEIGVIRSLGGRKRDVSYLFNAETFVIGLASGIFGVLFTYLLQLIANILVTVLSEGIILTIANLTIPTAIIMILVSVALTAISGLIPARIAAGKDPVVALRTE